LWTIPCPYRSTTKDPTLDYYCGVHLALAMTPLVLPKISKPVRRQFGIAHRVLDVLVAKILLQRPGIDTLIMLPLP
jgi:hypothetical protein